MVIAAATKNAGKIKEIGKITEQFGFEIISRDDAGIDPALEIEENGSTFAENSLIKAKTVCELCGMPAVADDSGLMVDFLGGAPGVESARFAGEHGNDGKNNEKLLSLMKNAPDGKRGAKFVCVVTLVFPDGSVISAEGECRGTIAREPEGTGGFGYDPLFIPEGYEKTFAELGADVKNKISHRSRALMKLADLLKEEG
ncbi:MAG: RdgB/HAM1 family non-canonical purine NTP pyrophosphatase [Anaerovoracaceae bacterium]|nr:RdgB/HAM1 family non-canonical purine NTP pyrophosphatase [Anaerovoracaceae bacterium]